MSRAIAAIVCRTPSTYRAPLHLPGTPTDYKVALPQDDKPIRRAYADKAGGMFVVLSGRNIPIENPGDVPAMALEVRPRLPYRCDVRTPCGTLSARWNVAGDWTVRFNRERVAGGEGFRPAPGMVGNHGPGSRPVGLTLLAMALCALPGSGSGIAGDVDSLKDWTPEGIKACDLPAIHDAVSMAEESAGVPY